MQVKLFIYLFSNSLKEFIYINSHSSHNKLIKVGITIIPLLQRGRYRLSSVKLFKKVLKRKKRFLVSSYNNCMFCFTFILSVHCHKHEYNVRFLYF